MLGGEIEIRTATIDKKLFILSITFSTLSYLSFFYNVSLWSNSYLWFVLMGTSFEELKFRRLFRRSRIQSADQHIRFSPTKIRSASQKNAQRVKDYTNKRLKRYERPIKPILAGRGWQGLIHLWLKLRAVIERSNKRFQSSSYRRTWRRKAAGFECEGNELSIPGGFHTEKQGVQILSLRIKSTRSLPKKTSPSRLPNFQWPPILTSWSFESISSKEKHAKTGYVHQDELYLSSRLEDLFVEFGLISLKFEKLKKSEVVKKT